MADDNNACDSIATGARIPVYDSDGQMLTAK